MDCFSEMSYCFLIVNRALLFTAGACLAQMPTQRQRNTLPSTRPAYSPSTGSKMAASRQIFPLSSHATLPAFMPAPRDSMVSWAAVPQFSMTTIPLTSYGGKTTSGSLRSVQPLLAPVRVADLAGPRATIPMEGANSAAAQTTADTPANAAAIPAPATTTQVIATASATATALATATAPVGDKQQRTAPVAKLCVLHCLPFESA